MTRVKRGILHTKKRKKILRLARGFRGGRSKLFTQAVEAVKRSLQHAFRDRRRRKRELRRLWITRLNAAVRQEGISYSQFIRGLKKAGIGLDRKTLSELAIENPKEFSQIVEECKKSLEE